MKTSRCGTAIRKDTFIMLQIATCLFVMLCIARGKLLQTPEATEAAVGGVVTLKCRTDVNVTASANPVEWRYKKVHGPAEVIPFEFIYKRKNIIGRFADRFSVVLNTVTGQCDLIIRDVQLDDAGRYTCDDRHAELIVFDKYPSTEFCKTTSASNDNQNNCGLELVTLSCDLSYRANQSLRPTLEWLEGNSTIHSADVKNNSDGSITSSVQLQKSQLEAAKFTCRVRYSGPMTTSRFTWSPPMNIMPMEKASSLSYGGCGLQTVECSDGKNPLCQYTWKDENGTEVSSSSSMQMAGKPNGNYTCLATCKVNQTSCSHVAKIFNYRCDDSNSQSTSATMSPPETIAPPESLISSPGITSPQIYIPVAIAALVIVTAISVLVVLVVRSKRKRNSYDENDAEIGQTSNNMEMTDLDGTKLQETDVMLTRNTLASL